MEKMERKIAEAICELNRWKTPWDIQVRVKRNLTKDEIYLVLAALEAFVPRTKWLEVWNSGEPAQTAPARRGGGGE